MRVQQMMKHLTVGCHIKNQRKSNQYGVSNQQRKINNILVKIYKNTRNPNFLCSIKTLFKEAKKIYPTIKESQVKEWLRKQLSYSLHAPRAIKINRSQYISSKKDEMWQADLIDLSNLKKENNAKYLLTVIDILSKYASVEKLFNKKPQSIVSAFKKIFKFRKPKILITDGGREFDNKIFKTFLSNLNIKHYIARNTEVKCAVVERFNRTIKEKIFKYLTEFNTKKFIDKLDILVKNYNNTINSRTKFTPSSINHSNENIAFLNLYTKRKLYTNSQLKIGDTVRLLNIKSAMSKGYTPNWTKETFKISKVLNTSPKRYKITDNKNNEIIGSFYSEELNKV